MINETEAAARAQRINTRMRALGVPFKDAHGYQALAASEGFPDWNRMRAAIRKAGRGGRPDAPGAEGPTRATDTTSALERPDTGGTVAIAGQPAVAAQPRERRTHWLIAPPGSGKSTMLSLRLLAEMEKSDGAFLLVDLAGRFEDLPDPIRLVSAHVTITMNRNETVDVESTQVKLQRPVPDGVRGVVVTFRNEETSAGLSRSERLLYALRKLPMMLDGSVPRRLLEGVTLICFDEVHQLREEAGSTFFNELLPFFESGGAHLVVSTQTIDAHIALTHRIGRRIICDPAGPHASQRVRALATPGVTLTEVAELVACPPSVDDDTELMEAIVAAVSISLANGPYVWSASSRSTRFQDLLASRREARTQRFGAQKPYGKPLEQFAEPHEPLALRGFALPVESDGRRVSRHVRFFLDQIQSAGVTVEGIRQIAVHVRFTDEHWRADVVALAAAGRDSGVRFWRNLASPVDALEKVLRMFSFPESLATTFMENIVTPVQD